MIVVDAFLIPQNAKGVPSIATGEFLYAGFVCDNLSCRGSEKRNSQARLGLGLHMVYCAVEPTLEAAIDVSLMS